ncbi:hypothetical protein E2C01_041198 [Portunus trituberculatus]|uniref:Uncharacterized protein n=1 Tax=Portunus trituberculatus TaxID=210409 RepID=A0A5B7FJE0_PORTR|nr:hypothetical protein [Portunus trituberculatus]
MHLTPKFSQAGELVTGEQLLSFIGDGSVSSDNMMLAVDQLERLHVALQAVVAVRTYLSLPWASMSHFSNQASHKEINLANLCVMLQYDGGHMGDQFSQPRADLLQATGVPHLS